MSQISIVVLIVVAGALQALGAAMNGQLNKSLVNPWLAGVVSFGVVLAAVAIVFAVVPRPLPTAHDVGAMPWWAPLGGLVGSIAVFAGLMFVQKIGAGTLNGLTIAANLVASLAIDQFALVGMPAHPLTTLRLVGAALMIGGVTLIAKF